MPPTYFYQVPGLHETKAELPQILGTLNLNTSILADSPINDDNLKEAQLVASSLKALHLANFPGITSQVIRSAEVRVGAIVAEHARAKYAPNNLDDLLGAVRTLTNKVDNLTTKVDEFKDNITTKVNGQEKTLSRISAQIDNLHIISRNNLPQSQPKRYLPLRKTKEGLGTTAAEKVKASQQVRYQLPRQPVPAISDLPQNFNRDVSSYKALDVVKMAHFYNDDFGVEDGDSETLVVMKFCQFLSTAM